MALCLTASNGDDDFQNKTWEAKDDQGSGTTTQPNVPLRGPVWCRAVVANRLLRNRSKYPTVEEDTLHGLHETLISKLDEGVLIS